MGEMARLWDLRWIGDRTLRLALGHEVSPDVRRRVHRAFRRVRDAGIAGLIDVTPASATIVMSFDPLGFDPGRAEEAIRASIEGEDPAGLEPDRLVEIPVCYDEDCAPDLGDVAAMHGLTSPDVARLHASRVRLKDGGWKRSRAVMVTLHGENAGALRRLGRLQNDRVGPYHRSKSGRWLVRLSGS